MNDRNQRLDPQQDARETVLLVKRAIERIVPYAGRLSVGFPSLSVSEPDDFLWLNLKTDIAPNESQYFQSMDDEGADEALAATLREILAGGLAYEGTVIVRLQDAANRPPSVVDTGTVDVVVDFGNQRLK